MYFSCVYLTLSAMRRQSKNGAEQICFPKFCITNVKENPEHDCFQLFLPSSVVSFAVWMLTLDPVILEHYRLSLEKKKVTCNNID